GRCWLKSAVTDWRPCATCTSGSNLQKESAIDRGGRRPWELLGRVLAEAGHPSGNLGRGSGLGSTWDRVLLRLEREAPRYRQLRHRGHHESRRYHTARGSGDAERK